MHMLTLVIELLTCHQMILTGHWLQITSTRLSWWPDNTQAGLHHRLRIATLQTPNRHPYTVRPHTYFFTQYSGALQTGGLRQPSHDPLSSAHRNAHHSWTNILTHNANSPPEFRLWWCLLGHDVADLNASHSMACRHATNM
jgi:hypothetical protein